jgi:hypothetical protein
MLRALVELSNESSCGLPPAPQEAELVCTVVYRPVCVNTYALGYLIPVIYATVIPLMFVNTALTVLIAVKTGLDTCPTIEGSVNVALPATTSLR